MSHLSQRLIGASGITSLLFISVYFSYNDIFKPIFALLAAGAICAALWEFYEIAQEKGYLPLSGVGIVGSIAYIYSVYLLTEFPQLYLVPEIILFAILFTGFLSYFFGGERPLSNLALTFFGFTYLTIPLALMITINFSYGRSFLVYLILVTKLTDTGAFFIGKKFGKTKLAPYISPNKTWEGAIGGFVAGVTTSLVVAPFVQFTITQALILGILLTLVSIFGDLTESLLKRDLGVKDSGKHIPGLGGMLDIVDSLVFTTPLMYFYLKLWS